VINPSIGQSYSNGGKQIENKKWMLSEDVLSTSDVNFLGNARTQPPITTLPQTRPMPKSRPKGLRDLFIGRKLKRHKTHPLVALESESPAADQFKFLREHIKSLRTDTRARSLLVTSAIKGDGKSMVAANLAAATALEEDGQVLLIDGDLRSPQIHRYFDIQPTPGLTDYLNSSSDGDLSQYVQDTLLPNLRILPAGKPDRRSSELLTKLKTDDLQSRFPDYQIIIDSPPVLANPDALVLTGLVEGIIMIVRASKTPRKRLFDAIASLNSSKLMGIIFNGTEITTPSNSFDYSAQYE